MHEEHTHWPGFFTLYSKKIILRNQFLKLSCQTNQIRISGHKRTLKYNCKGGCPGFPAISLTHLRHPREVSNGWSIVQTALYYLCTNFATSFIFLMTSDDFSKFTKQERTLTDSLYNRLFCWRGLPRQPESRLYEVKMSHW